MRFRDLPQYPSRESAAVSSALSYAPAAHLIDRQRKALSVFGPPFARRCAFWVSALVALVEGLALGALGLLFFNAFTWLSDRWLTTSRYREQLDAGAFGPGDGGRWYWPVQMAAAGLAVALARLLPGAPRELRGLFTEVRDSSPSPRARRPCCARRALDRRGRERGPEPRSAARAARRHAIGRALRPPRRGGTPRRSRAWRARRARSSRRRRR